MWRCCFNLKIANAPGHSPRLNFESKALSYDCCFVKHWKIPHETLKNSKKQVCLNMESLTHLSKSRLLPKLINQEPHMVSPFFACE